MTLCPWMLFRLCANHDRNVINTLRERSRVTLFPPQLGINRTLQGLYKRNLAGERTANAYKNGLGYRVADGLMTLDFGRALSLRSVDPAERGMSWSKHPDVGSHSEPDS